MESLPKNVPLIETIYDGLIPIALIVSHRFEKHGVTFFTDNHLSQQLAYMRHPKGKTIDPHFHNPVLRRVELTQEVLLIRRGRLRVDFYDQNKKYLSSRVLEAGDVILLMQGGHGFEVLEELEMFEVKQGPFIGEQDKTRFETHLPKELKFGY